MVPLSDRSRLLLLSFLILFLELAVIRTLSAYVLYLGYFTNFILLGAFLGIGAGALLGERSPSLARYAPAALFGLISLALVGRAQVDPAIEEVAYFSSTPAPVSLPIFVLLPLIFVTNTLLFTLLAQSLGPLLNRFSNLHAYSLNILGSLAGIALFTGMSALSTPSWSWFAVAGLAMLPFLARDRSFNLNLLLLGGVVVVAATANYGLHDVWSPYYRLSVIEVTEDDDYLVRPTADPRPGAEYVLLANGAGHQALSPERLREPFYELPYTAFEQPGEYADVLIIGAGGGNDVAAALAHGAQQVDAVEIDPIILRLGRWLHPDRPYADPRVTAIAADGRNYLANTTQQYDLIVFGLPDSLVLASNMGSVRLESYLFTREAFEAVRARLKPDGLFVLYNYYRFDWLIEKLGTMLTEVFGEAPIVHRSADPNLEALAFATLFAGPRAADLDPSEPGFAQMSAGGYEEATDDWPFLYVRQPSLPPTYGVTLALIVAFSVVYILRLAPGGRLGPGDWPFFFMGAAFLLLETRSITRFLLLFGSTWIVNALVFFAILVAVLIANWLAARFKFRRLWLLGALLVAALAANLLLPIDSLLVGGAAGRYLLASALLFSPIFFANLIYSSLFREARLASSAYGANLLGAMVGGAAEYLALLTGYSFLIVIAGGFYLVAFGLVWRGRSASVAKLVTP